ncbi:MAG: proline--tRNA ligase [Rhodospirillaceae bacterium]|nr:proline--tRNA ligase [Rhodospirillaceae bacterium]|tara:strand:- start:2847 stop:4178 length:1332 start_codon:yes stop_codon:yes gene_type:complete
MKISQFFLPTLKEAPSEAQVISHQLMLRSGMIKQSSAGIYSWLPLGFKVLKKIEEIIRCEQDYIGGQEILMPTIQPADLWIESGRYEDYGQEMLRIKDRSNRDLLYGPTNEELITDIFRTHLKSYKDLPLLLYHIQWKFRDELRPRYGVMRGREFLMKDSYSFDLDMNQSRLTYQKNFLSYLRIFSKLGLKAVPVKANPGPIGGDLSHEFVILAPNGESDIFFDKKLLEFESISKDIFLDKNLVEKEYNKWAKCYAVTDDIHNEKEYNKLTTPENRVNSRAIEVGHVFYFGTKYSKSMGANLINNKGEQLPVHMGSYGIGVSRLVGAIIEYSHDDKGIIWPENVAPFSVGILNLKKGDEYCDKMSELVYQNLLIAGLEVLYDDTSERAGSKFANMDLIGLPYQVFIGSKSKDNGLFEIKERATNKRYFLKLESLINHLTEKFN